MTVSHSFPLGIILTVFSSPGYIVCGESLNLSFCNVFFSWLTGIFGKKTPEVNEKRTYCEYDSSLVYVHRDHLAEVASVRVPHCSITLSILYTWEGSHCVQPIPWGGEGLDMAHLLEGRVSTQIIWNSAQDLSLITLIRYRSPCWYKCCYCFIPRLGRRELFRVSLTCRQYCAVLSASFLSGITRCSRFNLVFSTPALEFSNFSKGPALHYWRMVLETEI